MGFCVFNAFILCFASITLSEPGFMGFTDLYDYRDLRCSSELGLQTLAPAG